MLIDTKDRSEEEELMDDFGMEGPVLEKTLRDIAKLNQWLGGNRITVKGVQEILTPLSKTVLYRIVDIGCGNGDMLRTLALWGRHNGYTFQLIGIDANGFTIQNAQTLSKEYPEISYQCLDIFTASYATQSYDIILCTLTLHHFKTPDIRSLVTLFIAQAKVAVIINDLQRSRLAYYLFKIICTVWIRNPMARYDGAISILRGFTKKELEKLSNRMPIVHWQRIRWKWAFRYQWIIRIATANTKTKDV